MCCEFIVGGNLNNGVNAGSAALNLNNEVRNSNWNVAARDIKRKVFTGDTLRKIIRH